MKCVAFLLVLASPAFADLVAVTLPSGKVVYVQVTPVSPVVPDLAAQARARAAKEEADRKAFAEQLAAIQAQKKAIEEAMKKDLSGAAQDAGKIFVPDSCKKQ